MVKKYEKYREKDIAKEDGALKKKTDNKKFWNRYAKLYDSEVLRFSGPAYAEMYRLMSNVLTKEMRVLEIATGTGLIAVNIAACVHSVDATDFSPKMIEAAKKKDVLYNGDIELERKIEVL